MRWGIIGNGDVVHTKSGGAFRDKVIWNRQESVHDFIRGVDAVYIATPPSSHMGYARVAAELGKPTLTEKPMALNSLQAAIMVEAFRQVNVPLFAAYYRRCLPRFIKIKELIESGAIGEVRFTHIQHTMRPKDHPVAPVIEGQPLPWRYKADINGGGNFVDMGTHHLDLLDYFFGEVEVLHAEAKNTGGLYETEDTVFASMRAGGVPVTAQWCYVAGANQDRFHIMGDKGEIMFGMFWEDLGTKVRITRHKDVEEFDIPNPEWTHEPLVRAVETELNGGPVCPTGAMNGLRAMKVQDRILNG